MTNKPENPHAFAFEGETTLQHGMTLRDYFAAAALQGMCANGGAPALVRAIDAYDYADAMLEARSAS